MSRRRSQTRAKILTGIWLFTAAAALIVTVIYFGRLQKLYSAVGEIEAVNSANRQTGAKDATGSSAYSEDKAEDLGMASGDDTDTQGSDEGQVTDYAVGGPTDNEDSEKQDISEVSSNTDYSDKPYYYDSNLDPSKPIIALSFDDGPSQYTGRILEALQKYNVKATFFVVGYNVSTYPDRIKMIYDAGCEIGNHTTDHTSLKSGSDSEIKARVYDNEDAVNAIVPAGQLVVRPPYGEYNDRTKELIQRPMFNWSVDSLDWKTRDADSVVAEIKANAKDGYIILMHDLYESTAEATERIIPWLLEQGYQITTVSNMFEARGETPEAGHIYRYTNPAPAE